jgi:Relaxase/Mobilisation nuclease domain
VIIKGKSRGNGAQLGQYLVTPGKNEKISVLEIRGLAAKDVPGAVREMEAHAAGSRCEKSLYHASINPRAHEKLSDEQRTVAIDRLEAALGLTGQPRVVVLHQKAGRVQYHIVWDRIDLDRMAAISDSHNYRKHEEVARELEREFGHERVQGAHAERDGQPRPKRTPSRDEMQQAERTGLSPQQVTDKITGLWRNTDSGKAFAAALAEAGYVLGRGDRRDFIIIDPQGGTHSLARRIEGARVKDVRARMADIDASTLPSVQEARAIQAARQQDALRQEQELKAKHIDPDGLDWTHKAGMVEQQHSASIWAKKANEKNADQHERFDDRRPGDEAAEHRRQLREAFLRALGREPEGDWGRESGPDPGSGQSR